MDLSDILALARAGYSRDQIEQMNAPAPQPAEPTPAAPTPAAPTPAAPVAPDPGSFNELYAQLAALIQNAPQPAAPTPAPAAPQPAAPTPAPAAPQPAAPTPAAPQPAAPAAPAQDAAQILRALGSLAQGVSVPNPQSTIEERIGNTLKLALGVPEKTETGGSKNGF